LQADGEAETRIADDKPGDDADHSTRDHVMASLAYKIPTTNN
jgi:hypothetical protein